MAEEELQIIRLKDDFYRDGFYKVLFAFAIIIVSILSLIALSVYVYLAEPKPVIFSADDEWRILPPVPLNQPYLKAPDLIQWVSEVVPAIFTYSFVDYTKQLKDTAQYFTTNGWQKFLDQINEYANFKRVQDSKLFINASLGGAPFIVNQGLLGDKYSWWVQMPITINYISATGSSSINLVIQALVVRVPTLNNLDGVGIENMIVSKGGGNQIITHG